MYTVFWALCPNCTQIIDVSEEGAASSSRSELAASFFKMSITVSTSTRRRTTEQTPELIRPVMKTTSLIECQKKNPHTQVTAPHQRRHVTDICRTLTFSAVVALPARETDAVTGGGTLVVSKVVVSGSAQVGTARAVVMGVARHPVFVPHHGMGRAVLVLRPILPHVQPPLRCQAGDQRLPCNNTHRHNGIVIQNDEGSEVTMETE